MAENYTLVAGMDFARELGDKLADSSDAVLAKTRQLVKEELQGLRQSVGEIVRAEIGKTLESMQLGAESQPVPQPAPPQTLRCYSPPKQIGGY